MKPSVLLLLLAMGVAAPSSAHSAAATPVTLGSVLEVQGNVRLRRASWSRSLPAAVASELRTGDTVELDAGARAILLCPNLLTVWRPLPGAVSGAFQECPRQAEAPLTRLGRRVTRSRGIEPPLVVMAPSGTAVVDPTPLLRWSSPVGARRVRVSVLDGRDPRRPIWGPVRTAEATLEYPERPALEPGIPYFVRVEPVATGGWTADGLPFVVLPESERAQIALRRREIEQRLPAGSARDLANAVYLLAHELRQDALDLLATLAARDESAPLRLLRARVREQTGLSAADDFRSALEAARRQGDEETAAEALVSLGRAALKRDEAVRLLRQAAAHFRALGDKIRAVQVEIEFQGAQRQP